MSRDLDDGPDDVQLAPVEVDGVVAEPDGLASAQTGPTGDGDEPAVPLHDGRNELPPEHLTLDDLVVGVPPSAPRDAHVLRRVEGDESVPHR